MLRIGKDRGGSKVGVFIYCQQHAREWVTPITCLETAERLLRNYAIDPQTKELVDNLDIFIIPSVNPDGSHYSLYDNNNQRRNMVNHCLPDTFQDPLARTAWGVDLNRNNTVGSAFDGYVGAALVDPANPNTFNQCTSDVFAGPSEASEAEIKNEQWVADTFSNIKFAINIHTYGGYFMWAPGAYKPLNRETLPAPNIGDRALLLRRRRHDPGRASRSTATRSSSPSGPARSPTSCTRRPATRPTTSTTARASSPTRSRPARGSSPSTSRRARSRAPTSPAAASSGFRPDFADRGPPRGVRVHRRQLRPARERAAVLARHHAAGDAARLRRRHEGRRAADQLPVHVAGRGRGHPLHDRRLDADARLARRTRTRGRGARARS